MLDEFDAATGAGEPAGPHDVAGIYDTVVELARRRLDGVRAASVTTWDGRKFSTAAATDDGAVRADLLQYDRQSGPCVAAVRDVRECHVPELSTDPRWPADARAEAADLGF